MNEINDLRGLWRGKRIDNGKWVKGFLSKSRNTEEKPALLKPCIDFEDKGVMVSCIVDPSTLGECACVLDKNGKPIFEGDIVRYSKTLHKVVFEHRYNNAYFGIAITNIESWHFGRVTTPDYMEVIGNIHDNPELLKGGN